jgi:hypothetical protein
MTFANERTLLAWESASDAGAKQAFRWAGQAGLIERHHPILDTKNQQPRRGEAHYFETWADVEALADDHVRRLRDVQEEADRLERVADRRREPVVEGVDPASRCQPIRAACEEYEFTPTVSAGLSRPQTPGIPQRRVTARGRACPGLCSLSVPLNVAGMRTASGPCAASGRRRRRRRTVRRGR